MPVAEMNKIPINFGAFRSIIEIGGDYLRTGPEQFEKKSRGNCHAILKDSLSVPQVVNQIYEIHKNNL
jgi:hypothetical protein